MDYLESAMNIPQIFEKYPDLDCSLNIKLKIGSVKVLRADDAIRINYKLLGQTVSSYKIILYSEPSEDFYYTFFDNYMKQGKALMFDQSKENHPEFFEWMIWNLP